MDLDNHPSAAPQPASANEPDDAAVAAPPTGPELAPDPEIGPNPELVALLRLLGTAGLSPRILRRLLQDCGSAVAVLSASAARLASIRGVGVARASLITTAPDAELARSEVERMRVANVSVLRPGVRGWPERLEQLPDPPPALFVRGALEARSGADPAGPAGGVAGPGVGGLGEAAGGARGVVVAIVGARRASAYGLRIAKRLGAELAECGISVVSGLARGVDTAAHRGALSAGGHTAAILGSGLARLYPPENVGLAREIVAAGGGIASELTLDAPPLRHHFPRRNRVMAALADAIVVVEAGERSGSLITADHALDIGRDVLAVPGRIDAPGSRGTHRLLAQGAAICEGAADVLAALGLDAPAEDGAEAGGGAGSGEGGAHAARRVSDPAQRALLEALAGDERHADELLERTGLDVSAGLAALSALELSGLVEMTADGRYGLS